MPTVPGLLSLFAYTPNVAALMASYLMVRMLSVFGVVGTEALGNFYAGLGNTRPHLVAGTVTMTANIALNYLLIEPRFGLPGYGVSGAAWASVAASFCGFTVLLIGFVRGVGYERIVGPLRLRRSEFARVLRFGVPSGMNWFFEFLAFAAFVNVVVGHLGTTVLGAFNVVIQVNSLSFMPAFGVASAGAVLVGETIGRRAHHEVTSIVKVTGVVAAAWMCTVGLIYLLFPGPIFGLFEAEDGSSAALVEVGATMLVLSALWQFVDAVAMVLSEALRAAGDTAWCMAARLLLAWLLFVPLSWVAVVVLGGHILTVMLSVIGYLTLLCVAFLHRFVSGRWRDIELVGEPQAA